MKKRHGDALQVVLSWQDTPEQEALFDGTRPVQVGDAGSGFVLPDEVLPGATTLATRQGDGWTLHLPPGATVTAARFDGDAHWLGDVDVDAALAGGRQMALAADVVAVVELGAFTFHVRRVARTERVATVGFDFRPWRFVALSAALHLIMVGLFMLEPPDASALTMDRDSARAAYLRYHLASVEPTPPPDDSLLGDHQKDDSSGQAMKGDEGRTGTPHDRRHAGGVAVRGHSDDHRVPLTASTVHHLATFGVLAAAGQSLSTISSPYGAANAAGFSDQDAYGPRDAADFGFGPGTLGFGMTGVGHGTCRPGQRCGDGTVGVGDIGPGTGTCTLERFHDLEASVGHAAAVERCSGTGGTGVSTHLRPHHTRGPIMRPGVVDTRGGLAKEQIRRVVARNINQVRFCYEQQLNARPDLSGRVTVQFVVQPSGAVLSANVAQGTLRDATVERCIAKAVQRWTFPQSPGVTAVTYPFMFQPAE